MGQLKEKLAASLPKVEVDAVKAELQDKITKLEAKLAGSVPRCEVKRISAENQELERKLAVSNSAADSMRSGYCTIAA